MSEQQKEQQLLETVDRIIAEGPVPASLVIPDAGENP